jgi:hypothetical protein
LLSAPEYEENAISSHVQDLILIPSLYAVDGRFARSGLVSLRMARNIKRGSGIEITPSGRQLDISQQNRIKNGERQHATRFASH